MNTNRKPELAPVKLAPARIVHSAGARVSWVGLQVTVTLRNGDVVKCQHSSGHRGTAAYVDCATKLVARLNLAAGTSTAEVEAAKA